jgi:hypothetical protein
MIPPYSELLAKCLPHLEAYHEDLTVHDLAGLTAYPDIPFLHYTRKWGTQLIFLPPHDHPEFPPHNVSVPYLFGEADRWHILKGKVQMAEYPYEGLRIVHWFDGTTLREIPVTRAITIAREYRTSVEHAWKSALNFRERHSLRLAA